MTRAKTGTFAILALVALGGACGGPPPKQPASARSAASADPWAKIERRAEWLYATGDAPGSRSAECHHVLEAMRAEEPCVGGACVHAHTLAEEWLARCPTYEAGAVSEVKELDLRWRAAARTEPNACGAEAETILKDGCDQDPTCAKTAQAWATQCADGGTTPLVVRMVERVVERRTGQRSVSLDLRSCDALRGAVSKAARCGHRFQCGDALEVVETWRSRCESANERTTALDAILPRIVLAAAERPDLAPVTLVRADAKLDEVTEKAVPLPLVDGTGSIVSVCGERVLDVAGYLEARARCQGGEVRVVRAWKVGPRDVEVRAARLPHVDAATFERTFPEIVAAGEPEARDARDARALATDLEAAAKLAASNGAEALAALARAVLPRVGKLRKSAVLREVLTAHDDALVPALRELGARKVKAARGRIAAADLVGLVQRGSTCPLADVDASGTVVPGAGALDLDLVEAIPVAMAAYRAGFAPAHKLVRGARPDARTLKRAVEDAGVAATECGVAEKRVDELEHALVACASGRATCDEAQVTEHGVELEKARAAAEAGRARVVATMTGVAVSERAKIADAAAAAGCLETWW